MFRPNPTARGFTLLESLVALAIVLLASLLALSLIWQQPRVLERLDAQRRALAVLEGEIESLRAGGPWELGSREWVVAPSGRLPAYHLRMAVLPTGMTALFDVRIEARYEMQHREWLQSIHTRLWTGSP